MLFSTKVVNLSPCWPSVNNTFEIESTKNNSTKPTMSTDFKRFFATVEKCEQYLVLSNVKVFVYIVCETCAKC